MKVIEKTIPTPGTTYKKSNPGVAILLENRRLTEEGSPDDVRHLIFDISQNNLKYIEGQSIGVLAPGINSKGKANNPRLYSVASSRSGDDGMSTSVSLCVKRVQWFNEETKTMEFGVASNYLCDLKVGDVVKVIGPLGRNFLLPEDDKVNLIMIGVGTGIAPFRAFIHYIYRERGGWKGKTRLFYGAKTGMETLYMNMQSSDISQYFAQETFQAFKALSNEHKTAEGEKLYVQNRLEENERDIWAMIKEGNFCLYICGLKAIAESVDILMGKWAAKEGKDWMEMKANFLKEKRWVVEVY